MEDKIKIITNNRTRELIGYYQLSDSEKKEFDWIDPAEVEDTTIFFRYRGNVYCLDEFMRLENYNFTDLKGWDGYMSDSFFSGVLIKYPLDCCGDIDYESVIVGYYLS